MSFLYMPYCFFCFFSISVGDIQFSTDIPGLMSQSQLIAQWGAHSSLAAQGANLQLTARWVKPSLKIYIFFFLYI